MDRTSRLARQSNGGRSVSSAFNSPSNLASAQFLCLYDGHALRRRGQHARQYPFAIVADYPCRVTI
ncbi:hypothetical protein CC86DRAFT_369099 [Ophiobolus disseminans]|uniref:Uncharacterized protein n=1 Tax=Ophiobolus disseminans TaxID=1469910 RepID=A0A6A7A415_9PLEO|nr:hypothetical protein CC86DRAFT_369099 [Ophiobolus disseminans]